MVNHASVLVQTEGFNFITDPIWSERCSPVSFAGPKRHRPAGIPFDQLPRIDAVLISHNHYDHLDLPTLRRLEQRDAPLVVAGLGTKKFWKQKVLSMWWDEIGGRHTRSPTMWRSILSLHNIGLSVTFLVKMKCCGGAS